MSEAGRAIDESVDQMLEEQGVQIPDQTPLRVKVAMLAAMTGNEHEDLVEDELDDALSLLQQWLNAVSGPYQDISDVRRSTEAFLRGKR